MKNYKPGLNKLEIDLKARSHQGTIDAVTIWLWGMFFIDFWLLSWAIAILVPTVIILTIRILNRGKQAQMRKAVMRELRDNAIFELRAEAQLGMSFGCAVVDIECSKCGEPGVALYGENQWYSICVEGHQLENVDI